MITVEYIRKILKRKKEDIILDLYLQNYDSGNYYLALVFNNKIQKYRVLYVPIDSIKNKFSVEEYFCYQFIFLHTVNFIIETINNNEKYFIDENARNKSNPNMDSYYIEFNTNVNDKHYTFKFTQYINKEFSYFFDLFVTLFDHAPNIVSELCDKILYEFKESNEAVRYNCCYEFDMRNSLKELFPKQVINRHKYKFDDISFIEKIGYRYYMILKDELFIIDYDNFKFDLNVYSGNHDSLGDEIYIFVKAIQNNIEKKLTRLKVCKNTEDFNSLDDNVANYYLCYGIHKDVEDDYLKVVNFSTDHLLDMDLLKKKLVKIEYCDDKFYNELVDYLNEKYEKKRVEELLDFIIDFER